MSLSESNIEELTHLEYTLSKEGRMTHLWAGPFIDDEEELLTRTFNNTVKQNNSKQGKPSSPIKKETDPQEEQPRPEKKVQWLDRLMKEEKK